MIHDGLVYVVATFLMRWSCARCQATFRHYPEGLRSHHRYVLTALFVLCARFLQDPGATYRRVARSAGGSKTLPLFYAQPVADPGSSERQKQREQTPALSHVTLWRCMAWLATLVQGYAEVKRYDFLQAVEFLERFLEKGAAAGGPAAADAPP